MGNYLYKQEAPIDELININFQADAETQTSQSDTLEVSKFMIDEIYFKNLHWRIRVDHLSDALCFEHVNHKTKEWEALQFLKQRK